MDIKTAIRRVLEAAETQRDELWATASGLPADEKQEVEENADGLDQALVLVRQLVSPWVPEE